MFQTDEVLIEIINHLSESDDDLEAGDSESDFDIESTPI